MGNVVPMSESAGSEKEEGEKPVNHGQSGSAGSLAAAAICKSG